MKAFQTIVPENTISQWVNAFNNNALASSDHTFYLGEILFSSVLYTGNETIGKRKIDFGKDISVDFTNVYPDDVVIDNWYVYFRNTNKIVFINDLHLDLTDPTKYDNYTTDDLYFVFLNSDLGYRVSHSPVPRGEEARIFRFVCDGTTFSQVIATFPRFGYFGSNGTYEEVLGFDLKPVPALSVGLNDGILEYDGVHFTNHVRPDRLIREAEYQEAFSVVKGGKGYRTDDVVYIDSNYVEVTSVNLDPDACNAWVSGESYSSGDEVYIEDLGLYRSLIEDNTIKPGTDASAWTFIDYVGVVTSIIRSESSSVSTYGTGLEIESVQSYKPCNIIYNTRENGLDFDSSSINIDSSSCLDYTNNTYIEIPYGKFSIQRVMYDYLQDTLVLQYGNAYYDSLDEAVSAIYSVDYPFPYGTYIFPVLGFICVKSGCTNVMDEEQCRFIQVRTRTSDIRDTELLATDDYARGLIVDAMRLIKDLQQQINVLRADLDSTKKRLSAHTSDYANPHRTTPWNLVNGFNKDSWLDPNTGNPWKVEDLPLREGSPTKVYIDKEVAKINTTIINLKDIYVKKSGDTMTGTLTINKDLALVANGTCNLGRAGIVSANSVGAVKIMPQFIVCNGYSFFVGALPVGADTNKAYGIMK